MKKLIIIGILILALVCVGLLSGCGSSYIRNNFYSLDWYSPEGNGAFTNFVNSMDTPQKIAGWMADNCDYTIHPSVFSPYEFWTRRWGDCSEYAVLSSWCGHENGWTTYLVYIGYTDGKAHRICIYDMGATYSYTTTGHYHSGFSSFAECVDDWDDRTDKTVDFYTVHAWNGDVVKKYNVTSSTKFITDPEPSGSSLTFIGSEAINRPNRFNFDHYTIINCTSSAQVSGNINEVKIYVNTKMTSVKIATFYKITAGHYSTRDYVYIGSVVSGENIILNCNLDVEVGDYIGISAYTGAIDLGSVYGAEAYSAKRINIPCTNAEFTRRAGFDISLGGIVIE